MQTKGTLPTPNNPSPPRPTLNHKNTTIKQEKMVHAKDETNMTVQTQIRIPAKTTQGYFTILKFKPTTCTYCGRTMCPRSRSSQPNRNGPIRRCRICVCREAGCYSNLLRGSTSPKHHTENGTLMFNPTQPWKFLKVWNEWGIRKATNLLEN